MAIDRRPMGRVSIAGVGTTEEPIPDNWTPEASNTKYLWFPYRPRLPRMGDHVFALAPGRDPTSVVVALFEVTDPEPKLTPANTFDPDRWPWNIGVRLLTAVSPRVAYQVPGVRTPRSGLTASRTSAKSPRCMRP